jgi:hypothetical protein
VSRAGGGEILFYVRRHTCADGAFEWYVLNVAEVLAVQGGNEGYIAKARD